MAENKTVPTNLSVDAYIEAIEHPQRKEDCKTILKLMTEISGREPVMWGSSIVGFGKYHYKYESGREGDMLITGFRIVNKPSLYILWMALNAMPNFWKKLESLKPENRVFT